MFLYKVVSDIKKGIKPKNLLLKWCTCRLEKTCLVCVVWCDSGHVTFTGTSRRFVPRIL